jgi:hypothetical protein
MRHYIFEDKRNHESISMAIHYEVNLPLGLYPSEGRTAGFPCIICSVLRSAMTAVEFLPL